MTKPAERYTISLCAWDDKPPYAHWVTRSLTWAQVDIYQRVRDTKSLGAGLDYLLKVGKETTK